MSVWQGIHVHCLEIMRRDTMFPSPFFFSLLMSLLSLVAREYWLTDGLNGGVVSF